MTSARSVAALDLALHIVRSDHGAQIASFVSRRLVFSAFRDGGQQQFIEHPVPSPGQAALWQNLDWARARLGTALSVADLARHAHLSPTTLHRRLRAELGTTPLAWLTAERVDMARRLIEQGAAPLDLVAHRSGLGTTANLRPDATPDRAQPIPVLATPLYDDPAAELDDDASARLREHLALPGCSILRRSSPGVRRERLPGARWRPRGGRRGQSQRATGFSGHCAAD